VKLHDYGCSLKAYRSELVEDMHLYGELHRFYQPGLHRRSELQSVRHHARRYGRSKYGLWRTFRGNGFVNDFVYEDIPDTTHARIWAVWSAF